MLPHRIIEQQLKRVLPSVLPEADPNQIVVRPCPEARFGDYQVTALMAMAKERRMNPRQLAGEVMENLDVSDWCRQVEVAGPGFLNFRLKTEVLEQALQAAAKGEHLFFEPVKQPRTIIVDFSSPNVAKPMHVGHIRSTILGDCLARVLRLLGHRVITDNHIGDWGTQFGKLIVGWKRHLDNKALRQDPLGEMERLYRLVHEASETDPETLEAARQELVRLQNGDEENLGIWREMINLSKKQFEAVYHRLGVHFDHALGESFYNPQLKDVVEDLRKAGIARQSEGAQVVFFEDDRELKDHPAIIQKRDGAANYTTTDLATLAYRLSSWKPNEMIYVTDGRQQLHFKQLFAIFRRWHPRAQVKLAHVWFGAILGEDGKPFRTRSGDTIRLTDLLDEAEERAYRVVTEKNPDLGEKQRREVARVVGIGGIKYMDLLPNRQSDYVFSWDKMLALNGNTAPYLLYAYTRIRSIYRKGSISESELAALDRGSFALRAPEEIALAKHLLNFGMVLESVTDEYRPNYLCNYLYELGGCFARFYESCPVLKSEGSDRTSRLALCDLTARVLQQGLNALGIETTEQM